MPKMTSLRFGASLKQVFDAPSKDGHSGSWEMRPLLNANAATSPQLPDLALQSGTTSGKNP